MKFKAMWVMVAAFTLSGMAWAGVTSDPVAINTFPGHMVHVPMNMAASDYVAGINGQLNYDPQYFHSVTVDGSAGSIGFTVLGNEVTPGQYRFVVYGQPTQILQLGSGPVIYFNMKAADTLPDGTSEMTFTMSAASKLDGTSFEDGATAEADVVFGKVTVNMNKTPVEDWALYQ